MSKALQKKQPLHAPQVAVAACSMALPESSSREIQLTPTGEFRSFDGRPVEAKAWRMTASLAHQIFDAAEQTQSKVFVAAERHKALMLAAVDPESYDFSGGWPLTYRESLSQTPAPQAA